MGSIPRWGRSPGGEHGNPLQAVFLPGESMHRGAWWATVHGIAKTEVIEVTYHVLTFSQAPTNSSSNSYPDLKRIEL